MPHEGRDYEEEHDHVRESAKAFGELMRCVERFVASKTGNEETCEDAAGVLSHFAFVVDGGSSPHRADDPRSGRIAAVAIANALQQTSPRCTAHEAAEFLTRALAEQLRSLGLEPDHDGDRPCASLACFSLNRREVWLIGGCQALLITGGEPGDRLTGEASIDIALASTRALVLATELSRGRSVHELRAQDPGRAFIEPLLRQAYLFRNRPTTERFSFSALDGVRVPDVRVFPVASAVEEVVLATDGYPMLESTLAASEAQLAGLLADDPLLIDRVISTKGLAPHLLSFDDRAYVRLRLEVPPGAIATEDRIPDLGGMQLAFGARWVEYAPFHPAGLSVEASYGPGAPHRPPSLDQATHEIAEAIEAGMISNTFDAPRYALVGTQTRSPDANTERPRLVLHFRDSSYSTFLASNGWNRKKLSSIEADTVQVDPRPEMRVLPWREMLAGGFANCLGACWIVVLENGGSPLTYLTRRYGGILDGYWDGAVDEGLRRGSASRRFDQRSEQDLTPDLESFILRAIAEEAGLQVGANCCTLFTAGHDTFSLQPALVGCVEVDLTREELLDHLRIAIGREESDRIRWLSLEPEVVVQTVERLKREQRLLPWVEIGLFGTLVVRAARTGSLGSLLRRLRLARSSNL